MQRVSRGAVFWGAALVTAGLVILAIQQGLIDEALLSDIGQWWPLLVIGAGVAVIFAGALGAVAVALSGILLGLLVGGLVMGAANLPVGCSADEPGALVPVGDGTFTSPETAFDIELSCASLDVSGRSGDGWSVEADEDTADELEVRVAINGVESVGVRTEDVNPVGGRRHVAVTIPMEAGTDLALGINAGEANLDLAGGRWGQLDLEGNAMAMTVDLSGAEADSLELTLNAGSAEVVLDDDTAIGSPIRFGANAGSIEVCAPESVGLQVTLGEDVATGHNLDEAGLDQSGNVWRTDGYDSADTQIEMEFEGNAASFTLSPEGECS
jgi:hypothetical protein